MFAALERPHLPGQDDDPPVLGVVPPVSPPLVLLGGAFPRSVLVALQRHPPSGCLAQQEGPPDPPAPPGRHPGCGPRGAEADQAEVRRQLADREGGHGGGKAAQVRQPLPLVPNLN